MPKRVPSSPRYVEEETVDLELEAILLKLAPVYPNTLVAMQKTSVYNDESVPPQMQSADLTIGQLRTMERSILLEWYPKTHVDQTGHAK